MFYSLRSTFKPSKSNLVFDLRPEGYQLVKLREFVLSGLSAGFQQHLLTAFWNYLLITEIAYQVVKQDRSFALRAQDLTQDFAKRLVRSPINLRTSQKISQPIFQSHFCVWSMQLRRDAARSGGFAI